MSSEWTNNEAVVYQLTTEIKEESMHDNLVHVHDGKVQVFRLDKYQRKVKKVQIYFSFKMWKKDYLVYAVDKVNRKYEISTIHISNTAYRLRHSHNVLEDKMEMKTNER
jgi:hypothetical protein